jgi:hypothetical protein
MTLEIWAIKNVTTDEFHSKRNRNKDDSNCPRIFYRESHARAYITSHTQDVYWITDYWKENSFKPVKLLCKEANEYYLDIEDMN